MGDAGSDYALGPVPQQARMPWYRVSMITLGIMGAMIFMQVSGQLALRYGRADAVVALVYATVVTGLLATVFAGCAARYGLSCALITRGCGYGHAGARITALFYVLNFVALAATEGAIMASAIHAYLTALPLWLIEVALTVVNIVLNWYGIALLERFQKYSLPVYLVLLVVAIVAATHTPAVFTGTHIETLPVAFTGGGVLAGMGVLNGIVALQALLTADYARFTRSPRPWRIAVIGFLPQLASFLVMGLVGIWFATRYRQADPGVYLVLVLGLWGVVYTVLTQLRINVINIYSCSLSLQSLFGTRLPRMASRKVWVLVAAGLALLAMLSDTLGHLGVVLTLLGSFMFAWVGTLLAQLLIVRPVWRPGNAPEYRTDQLPAWGRTGLPSVLIGALAGSGCAVAAPSPAVSASSGFVALVVACVLHLVLARSAGDRTPRAPSGQRATMHE